MYKVNYHPNARAALNVRAERIFASIRCFTREELQEPPAAFKPDTEAIVIKKEDMRGKSPYYESFDNITGEVKRIVFNAVQGLAGIEGEGCKLLESLTGQAIKVGNLGTLVSQGFVRNHLLQWLLLRLDGEAAPDYAAALAATVEEVVADLEIWVPVFYLSIEPEFSLGEVVFRTISREVLDSWYKGRRAAVKEGRRHELEEHLTRERQKMQGSAAAVLKIRAEPSYGAERAVEIADNAVSYLSFFHIANLAPRLTCYTRILGKEYVPSYKLFIKKPSGKIQERSHVLEMPPPERWEISSARLEELLDIGLAKLHEILLLKEQSEFHVSLLDALLMYSRNTLEQEPVQKLLYVLIALESTLLKDQSEPIQQNIGERLAFAVGSDTDERREIVSLVRTCYDFRSKYIHHGFGKADLDKIAKLMKHVWTLFCRLINNHDRFESRRALIDALDARKFE